LNFAISEKEIEGWFSPACRVFKVDTSTCHYKSDRPGRAHLEQRIKEFARRGCATATGDCPRQVANISPVFL
jgi:hypothetical protein